MPNNTTSANQGLFITFEGPEGAGKTTQIELLKKYLTSLGHEIITTREPGGTPIGEEIRNILKNPSLNSILSNNAEVLLLQAARAQHVDELITPALKSGKTVICDRFSDSSLAYQGIARDFGEEIIDKLNKFSTEQTEPDLTFLLDISPEIGLKRAEKRELENSKKDRWEEQSLSFHIKVREAFLKIANEHPERVKVVSAEKDIKSIQQEIVRIIKNDTRLL